MVRANSIEQQPVKFRQRLREISMFFQGKDEVHKTLRRLIKRLEKVGIAYAVIGGMAINAHGHVRTTGDVDVLLTAEGFAEFCRLFVPKKYENVAGRPRRFVDRRNQVCLDVLISGRFPGSGQPGPFAFPDPEQVRQLIGKIQVVNLPTLVELKLAARRYRDFGDVVELIRVNNLDESFTSQLHPSVRQDFIECLEEKRREDEYEAQN
jgi:hypothetical protein